MKSLSVVKGEGKHLLLPLHPSPFTVHRSDERGAALLISFFFLLVLIGLATAAAIFSQNSQLTAKAQLLDKQAFYVAEGGAHRARQMLIAGTWTAAASPGNTYTETFGPGEYRVTIVDNGGDNYTVTSEGYVSSIAAYAARRQTIQDQISVTPSNGTNHSLALGTTASASSSGLLTPAILAKDGLALTSWAAGSNGNAWLKMDYGSAITLNKVVVSENSNIAGVSIEWSDDNSAWTTASGLSVIESPSETWTATFTASAHRYVRASLTASGSTKPSVKEMESYNASITALGAGEVTTQW